jgi:hypothetical protein
MKPNKSSQKFFASFFQKRSAFFLALFVSFTAQAENQDLHWQSADHLDGFEGRTEHRIHARTVAPTGEAIDVEGFCRDQDPTLSLDITVSGPARDIAFDPTGFDGRHVGRWRFRIDGGPVRILSPIMLRTNMAEVNYVPGYLGDTTAEELQAARSFVIELPLNTGNHLALELDPGDPLFRAARLCFGRLAPG